MDNIVILMIDLEQV